jgi:signal transduction histidine kinase
MLLLHPLQNIDHRLVLLLQMMHYRLHFFLGLGVNQVVLLRHQAVFRRLPVLRHQDDRRERTEFNLGVLVLKVADRLSGDAHGCETRINQLGSLWVNWDATTIDQVISNLLANAYKYGQGRPVEIKLEGLNGVVRINVRDR